MVEWLVQISVHTATDLLRRRRRRRWLLFVGAQPVEEPAAAGSDEGAREAVRATYRVLDRMRPEDRTVFALRFIDGMDIDVTSFIVAVVIFTVIVALLTPASSPA